MSDLKKKKVFENQAGSDSLNSKTNEASKAENVSLNTQTLFDEQETFYPSEIEEKIETEIEDAIEPKPKRWLLKSLVISLLGLSVWQLFDSLISNIQAGEWLSLGWNGFLVVLASIGIGAFVKELFKLRRLKNKLSIREQAEKIIEIGSVSKATKLCEGIYNESQKGGKVEDIPYQAWKNTLKAEHSAEEVFSLYDSIVLKEKDKQAEKLIAKYASEAAVMVAVSPLAVVDMLLIGWRNISLLNRLTLIYGIELGYWSRIKLIKMIFVHMAAAGASELAIDVGADVLSMDLTAKVSVRAAQGIGVGILTARLAIKTVSLIRPLTWPDNEQIKLNDVRKALVHKLKSII